MDKAAANGTLNVSIKVQKEDVYSHPDLELCTYTYCWRWLHWQILSFRTYFVDVKTSVWVFTENMTTPKPDGYQVNA